MRVRILFLDDRAPSIFALRLPFTSPIATRTEVPLSFWRYEQSSCTICTLESTSHFLDCLLAHQIVCRHHTATHLTDCQHQHATVSTNHQRSGCHPLSRSPTVTVRHRRFPSALSCHFRHPLSPKCSHHSHNNHQSTLSGDTSTPLPSDRSKNASIWHVKPAPLQEIPSFEVGTEDLIGCCIDLRNLGKHNEDFPIELRLEIRH